MAEIFALENVDGLEPVEHMLLSNGCVKIVILEDIGH